MFLFRLVVLQARQPSAVRLFVLIGLLFCIAPGWTSAEGPDGKSGDALVAGEQAASQQAQPAVTNAKPETASLDSLKQELVKTWPDNRSVRIVFHGHSVPAGYFRSANVHTFDAYPSLFHRKLAKQFPTAVIEVIVTAIGGENSVRGAERFERDVLSLRPDLLFIDYALNDRGPGLADAKTAWSAMIQSAQQQGIPVVLLTPTPDMKEDLLDDSMPVAKHAIQIRDLSQRYDTVLVDSFAEFRRKVAKGTSLESLMSQGNHPNREGHKIVASAIAKLFQ